MAELCFGFVPQAVLDDLVDVGNWKKRAHAVSSLHGAFLQLDNKAVVLPQLPGLLDFVLQLLGDHNFRVALSGLQLLTEIAGSLPDSLTPHLRVVVPALVTKLFDNHQAVRDAAQLAITGVTTPSSLAVLVDMLAPLIEKEDNGVPALVKELVIDILIMALLTGRASGCDPVRLIKVLLPTISCPDTRLSSVAMEALACLHQQQGPAALQQQLRAAGATELLITTVLQANIQNFLPALNLNGLVQHKLVPQQPPGATAGELNPLDRGSLEGWMPEGCSSPAANAASLVGAFGRGSLNSAGNGAGQLSWGLNSSSLRTSGSFKGLGSQGGSSPAPGGGSAAAAAGAGMEAAAGLRSLRDMNNASLKSKWDINNPGMRDSCDKLLAAASPDPQEDSLSTSLGMRLRTGSNSSSSSMHNSLNSGARAGPEPAAAAAATSNEAQKPDMPRSRFFQADGSSSSSSSNWTPRHTQEDKPSPAAATGAPAAAAAADDVINKSPAASSAAAAGGKGSVPWSISLTDYGWGGSPSPAAAAAGTAGSGPGRVPSAGDMAAEADGLNNGYVPGRAETGSPDRGQRLANLKRRQQEKRAATAVGNSRPGELDSAEPSSSGSFVSSPHPRCPEGSSSVHGIAGAAAAAPLLSWGPAGTRSADAAGGPGAPRGMSTASADSSYKAGQPLGWSNGGQTGLQGYLKGLSDSNGPASPTPDPLRLAQPGLRTLSADRPDYGMGNTGHSSRFGIMGGGNRASGDVDAGSAAAAAVGGPLGLPASAPAGQYRTEASSPSPTKLWNNLRRKPATSAASPAPSSSGSPAISARPSSVVERAMPGDADQADLQPLKDPDASVRQVISKLQACNVAARKELDWQGQQDALTEARRLVAHHPETIRPLLHEFVVAAAPAIDQLRSTTAKSSLQLFQELFISLGRGMDREVEEVVPVLLKKGAEVSTAGRDTFLAQEAARALTILCQNASETRCMTVLLSHVGHKSPHARTRVAAHLDELCSSNGCLVGLASSNWTLLERLVKAAAGFLEEGSLDTRTHAKRCLWALRTTITNHTDWERLMTLVTPDALKRKVAEVLDPAAGCPPFPSSRSNTARSPTRGRTPGPGSPAPAPSPGGRGTPRTPESLSAITSGSALRALGANSSGSSSGTQGPGSSMLVRGSGGGGSACSSPVDLGPPSNGSLAARRRSSNQGSVRRRLSTATAEEDGSSSALTAQGLGAPSYSPVGSQSMRSTGSKAPDTASSELTNAVEKVTQHMCSKEWRERCDALRAFVVLLPAVPALPDGLLQELLGAVVPRLSDANAKVNEQALEALVEALPVVADRVNPCLASLTPALVTSLGSSNERVRAVAVQAFSSLLTSCSSAGPVVPLLCHAVLNSSSVKGKAAVVTTLAHMANQVHRSCPTHVSKHLLPTCGSLLSEPRGELRSPATELLLRCAQLLGPGLSEAVSGCALPIAAKLREHLLLAGYGDM